MPERIDPFDTDPRIRWLKEAVDAAAEREALGAEDGFQEGDPPMKMEDFGMGFCHIFSECKKRILKERYGIDWQSPAELNPMNCYD